MNFDAVVVGAGPGGAFSAYWLAKNGLKVLLLEKKTASQVQALRRLSFCKGGLSPAGRLAGFGKGNNKGGNPWLPWRRKL